MRPKKINKKDQWNSGDASLKIKENDKTLASLIKKKKCGESNKIKNKIYITYTTEIWKITRQWKIICQKIRKPGRNA